MRGDVINRGHQLGVLYPYVPDLTGRHRNVCRALHALDHLDKIADFLLAAKDRFVADDDAVDVAVALGELHDRMDFALVAILIFVDPGTCGNPQSKLGCDARHELDATSGRIGAYGARERGELLKVGSNLCCARLAAGVWVCRAFERRVGNAGKLAVEVGGANIIAH